MLNLAQNQGHKRVGLNVPSTCQICVFSTCRPQKAIRDYSKYQGKVITSHDINEVI